MMILPIKIMLLIQAAHTFLLGVVLPLQLSKLGVLEKG